MSFSAPLPLEDIVPILTAEAESEILYPNHHGCKLLNILGGYVEFLFSYQDVPPTFVHLTLSKSGTSTMSKRVKRCQ